MSAALKCPNPSCPYLFDPTRVPAGVVLSCPRCGMQFSLGAPGAPPGAAPPTEPAPFGFDSGAPAPGPEQRPADQPPPARPRGGVRTPGVDDRGGRKQVIFLSVVALALIGGSVAFIYVNFIKKKTAGDGPAAGGPTDATVSGMNVGFTAPGDPWAKDDDLRNRVGLPNGIAAYKRTEPDAYMAFGARDFGFEPRLSDLQQPLLDVFKRLYQPDITYTPSDAEWLDPAAKARRYAFRAKLKDGTPVEGDAYHASFKGIGYWAIAWAPEADYARVRAETDAARAGFRLRQERESWAGKPYPGSPYYGNWTDPKEPAARVQFRVLDEEREKKWVSAPVDKDRLGPVGERARFVLYGPTDRRNADGTVRPDRDVFAVGVVLDAGPAGPLQTARDYAEELWRRREEPDDVTFTERKDDLEALEAPPDGSAEVVRLAVAVKGQPSHAGLLVVSGVKMPNGRVAAVVAWSPLEGYSPKAQEPRLVRLARTLRGL